MTAEDLAFEQSLQEIQIQEPAIERGPNTTLTKEKTSNDLLSNYIDCQPAKDINELLNQVFLAKQHGADSIEASPELIKTYTLKSGFPSDVGFFFFQDIKVWIPGFHATHSHLESETIEHRVFGHSKNKIQPIMQLDEKAK